jgi:cysteine protease ATG4
LVNNFQPEKITCCVCADSTIYKEEVRKACLASESKHIQQEKWRSLILFIPLRLGVDKMNPIYMSELKKYLSLPQTVGIAGGITNSSMYIIGYEGRLVRLNL